MEEEVDPAARSSPSAAPASKMSGFAAAVAVVGAGLTFEGGGGPGI
jgi:hypothetical protein